jgi:L-fuculose-phosphate aldolase
MGASWSQRDPAFLVAAARRMLARNECESRVAGQVVMRSRDRDDALWISAKGYSDSTLPEDVLHWTFDAQRLAGNGEMPRVVFDFHVAVFNARPDVQAVVHSHSHYVEVVSTTGEDIGGYSADSCLFHEEQAHFSEDGIAPSVDTGRITEALGGASVLLMANHGALIADRSIEMATIKAIALETSARCHYEAQLIGGKPMPTAESAKTKAGYEQYFIPDMWAANLRRLRHSDPELFADVSG